MKRLLLSLLVFASFASAQIPEYKLTLSPAVVESLAVRDVFSNGYLPAKFEAGDSVYNDALIRYKGKSNRNFPKKPIRIRFAKHHHFFGVENLNLHASYTDKTFLREKLAWDLFEEMGELAPSASYATLTINGKPQGLYVVVDNVDHAFLKRHGLKEFSLYSAGGYYALADMTVQKKKLLEFYYPKEAGDKENYDDLYELLEKINQTPDEAFADKMEELFDMNSVYNWLAGNILMMMGDSYNKNYFLYRDDSRKQHQWIIIPWDYDLSFGLTGDPAVSYPTSLLNNGMGYSFPPLSGPANVLKDRLLQTPRLAERLRERVDTLLNTVFTNAHLDRKIDSLSALIHDAVVADPQKPGTVDEFADGADALKCFITARRNFLLATYVHPHAGPLNQTMLRAPVPRASYDCVGADGRQFAQVEFQNIQGLDSLLVDAHPDSMIAAFDTAAHPGFVRRFVKFIPYPARAKFTASVRLWYHDVSSRDREVSGGVVNERALHCFVAHDRALQPVPSRNNPVANVMTLTSISQSDCGPDSWFVLYVPSP